MKILYSTVYNAFIYASIIAFIIGLITNSKVSLGAYISGYSVLVLGILMILIILFSNILKINENASLFRVLYYILIGTGPLILMLGVIAFVLYLLIFYKEKIIKKQVAPGFNTFNSILVMLILVQLYLVHNNINSDRFEATKQISKTASAVIYLLGTFTAISSIILYTILKYYSTDGFQNINLF